VVFINTLINLYMDTNILNAIQQNNTGQKSVYKT